MQQMPRYDAWQSLAGMFFDQAARDGDKPFLWSKRAEDWTPQSWAAVAQQVSRLSRALRAEGLQPGDRVLLLAENRPEWLIADVAIMAARGISVPAYTTATVADLRHLLNDSGAGMAIVSTAALGDRLLRAMAGAPTLTRVIAMAPPANLAGAPVLAWDDALARGAALPDDVAAQLAQARRDDTACLFYTSGTGGTPKGVMLSHGNVLANCYGAHRLLHKAFGLDDEVFLSFLPLSHAYEHSAGMFFPMSIGAQIYYAESVERLAQNLLEVRPTIMTAVPRLYEMMHARILRAIHRQGGLKAKLFHRALALGRKRYAAPQTLGLLERLQDRLLERLVREKARARFGGRLKAMVSGGAALNFEIGLFFTALGVPILQGYGQTEAAPVVSCNPPGRAKVHTVGPPFAGVEVKIAADGELLVRGELVMQGYWGLPELTQETMRDGWLHTGDIGRIDADGYIEITDRKRDIIVFSGGDNISPARIEGFLTLQPEIAQAMVYGDHRPNLVAVLVPDHEMLHHLANGLGKPADLSLMAEDPALRQSLGAAVERVNAALSPVERVRKFVVAREPFTVDNEMMTPTLKVRRHKVCAAYATALDKLY